MGMDFDGVNDCVEVPHSASLGITDFISLEAWVKYDTLPSNWVNIVSKGVNDYATPFYHYGLTFMGGASARQVRLIVSIGASAYAVSSGEELVPGTWYHIVGTYDGANLRIYVNGMLKSERAVAGALNTSLTNLRFGQFNNNLWFDGLIDEVRIYNRALTADEIKLIYNSKVKGIGLQIHPANLKAYWPLDDFADGVIASGANTVIDRSRESNHGTPFGGPIGRAQEVLSYP